MLALLFFAWVAGWIRFAGCTRERFGFLRLKLPGVGALLLRSFLRGSNQSQRRRPPAATAQRL